MKVDVPWREVPCIRSFPAKRRDPGWSVAQDPMHASPKRLARTHAIVWSIGHIVHWGLANVERLQSLYMRATQWIEGHDLFMMDLPTVNSSSFVGVFQAVA
ncbi:MAG: hypothetical protein ACREYC_05725, partial [Gammaproteobacteria bacterium]